MKEISYHVERKIAGHEKAMVVVHKQIEKIHNLLIQHNFHPFEDEQISSSLRPVYDEVSVINKSMGHSKAKYEELKETIGLVEDLENSKDPGANLLIEMGNNLIDKVGKQIDEVLVAETGLLVSLQNRLNIVYEKTVDLLDNVSGKQKESEKTELLV